MKEPTHASIQSDNDIARYFDDNGYYLARGVFSPTELVPLEAEYDAIVEQIKACGDVVFFHYLTLHGSLPNRSEKLRKTVLCQLYAGNDRVEHGNKHPDEKLVLRGRNRTISRSGAS